jgi:hypothetical protein
MALFKKETSRRGILVVVAFAFFFLSFLSFATSRHFVPRGLRQLISIDHQIRRVLSRAERENLRSGVALEDTAAAISLSQDAGEISLSVEAVVTNYGVHLISPDVTKTNDFILESSPVLNL